MNLNIEVLVDAVYSFLKGQSSDVAEYLLIQHLNQEGLFDFVPTSNASFALFTKHFLIMHSLYLLQNKLAGGSQGLLIDPLNISLVDVSDTLVESGAVSTNNPKLSQYYLDLNNLKVATEESVDELLESFWSSFSQWQNGGDAFEVLGLSSGANWQEVQVSYRRKAQLEHPDKGGDGKKFTKYTEAYQQLKLHFGR